MCDRAYLKDLTQTILIVGVMFGAMICTTLSDKFGRKPIFLFSQWAMVVVGVANAFAPNYYVFTVLRFCTGVFNQVKIGIYSYAVLLYSSIFVPKKLSRRPLKCQNIIENKNVGLISGNN